VIRWMYGVNLKD